MNNANSNEKKPDSGKEQNTDRATSGGGLGQGREAAAGMPKEQSDDKGRPGKGMGGTSDTSSRSKVQGGYGGEIPNGPASSPTTSDVRPSRAGRAAREGGSGINISDHDTELLNAPSAGAEWNRQRGMAADSRNSDLKDKVSPTDVERRTGNT